MKAAAARECKHRLDDLRAGRFEAPLRLGEIAGVEDHQRAAAFGSGIAAEGEATGQAAIAELAVARAKVLEGPAEGLAVEIARARDVADGELDIVDAVIVAGFGHALSPSKSVNARAGA